MTHRFNIAILVAGLLAAAQASAGVVYEIEVTDYDASDRGTDQVRTSVERRQLKMQFDSKDDKGEMIFRGEAKEMIMVDHDERAYTLIDQQTIAEIGAKMSEASRAMEEALKNVPPEQRPMIEKMMKQRMPQMHTAPPRSRTELVETGERDNLNGYPCVRYDVVEDGRKVRELWVTDWNNVEGGEEVIEVFRDMAAFVQEMLASLPRFGAAGGQGFDDNMFEYMDRMDGFPVVTREFSNRGELTSESVLRSAEARSLDPAEFEPPSGYKRRSMMPQ